MNFFDSHCHPQFPHYDRDRNDVIERTLKEGVFMLCVGTDLETSKKAIELAQKYEGIWATVGLHHNEVHKVESSSGLSSQLEELEKLLTQPKVVGFGEIGLDYYRTEKSEDQMTQRQRFQEQLALAAKTGKPLVLHCRDAKTGSSGKAHNDMINILSKCYSLHDRDINSTPLGVVHSFTGTLDEAKKYLDLGFYLGFNGIITFTNQYDETLKYAPLEKTLLETDAPYLTPVPFRGKRNEPLYVKYTAERIAELKGLSYDAVAKQTFENTIELFNLRI